jgi:hypothetical protein
MVGVPLPFAPTSSKQTHVAVFPTAFSGVVCRCLEKAAGHKVHQGRSFLKTKHADLK